MFIAALFAIARTWKQPRCPSSDELIKKMLYLYIMGYYSVIKRNEFKLVLLDEPRPYYIEEVSQNENINAYIWNLERWY